MRVDFHTLNIIVSCIVTQSLFMGMIKHVQSAQSNKFTICLTMSQKRSLWWTSFFGCRLTSVSASSKYYSCRIKGTFGAIIRVWAPTKWTQKINLKFLGKLDDLKFTFESSIVWPKKNTEIIWKNMQQLPKPRCAFLWNMRQVAIQK